MVQKIHPRDVIWVPRIPPHDGHLSKKQTNLVIQYKDIHGLINSSNSNENNIWYLLENYAKGLFIMHTVRITIGWKG